MKRKLFYTALMIVMIVSMIFVSGCAETSKLAGSVSNITQEAQDRKEESSQEQPEEPGKKEAVYDASEFLKTVPEWDGQPFCEINGNKPEFEESEIWRSTQESLEPLDSLGRCGTANSCIGTDGMPDQPRGNISEIHPTGWHSDTYDGVEGGNLFNRCHLIAYKLSGDDAIDRNLITGTSYMNRKGMLPFEDRIEQYVESTGNHVMYRVEPCFKGDELVARGVHMQAVSVEDNGEGLSFNVFCYNIQPGIEIDYATGDNKLAETAAPDNTAQESSDEGKPAEKRSYVLNTNTRVFHYPECNSVNQMKDKNKREVEDTRDNILAQGFTSCGNCHP